MSKSYIEHRETIYEIARKFVVIGQDLNHSAAEAAMHSLFMQLLDACKEAQANRDAFMEEYTHD